MQAGNELPVKIQNAPPLQSGLALYYEAFNDLSSCRAIGMAEGPIPWTAINDYCDYLELYEEERYDMFYHVRSLDLAYLKYMDKKHGS